ncbi:unnamed protein product [Schistosoma rodhaini]|uniref:DNA-directed RNA polymerase III subunit n=1 Tax=Schistosoma rodhaini TaxID=6188 RepID=A0AA85EPG7_9TREM|nr:unnamed protein product [Schistosoma rodhaini]CAH8681621.1 unnamed protein product [Schistosoma rodhaini]
MNRGRRRGGGPSLSGLRDGVKRRLFDPHSVPTKPDPKFEVSRLIPFSVPKVTINSSLSDSSANNNPDVVKDDIDSLQINLFELTAKMEAAFRSGPFYHSVPELSEGVDVSSLLSSNSLNLRKKSQNMVSLLHLLVSHEINQWSDEDMNIKEPDDFYPKELISRTRINFKSNRRATRKSKLASQRSRQYYSDIDEVITDSFIQQVTETLPENDEDVEKIDVNNSENEDADSEDARWNGDANQVDELDELDDDEFDNDYCQEYFDNGEKDFSDDGLGGGDEDGGGAKYYE